MPKPVVTQMYRVGVRFEKGLVFIEDRETGRGFGPYPVALAMGMLATANLKALCPSLPAHAKMRETVVHFEVPV